MGKAKREHKERVAAGLEQPFRAGEISRAARLGIQVAARKDVVNTLKAADTVDQIEALDQTVAASKPEKLKKALMKNAPKEMDKAIKKYQKEGKPITVDALCHEIKTTPGFLQMCQMVGLDLEWFENLARERMEKLNA